MIKSLFILLLSCLCVSGATNQLTWVPGSKQTATLPTNVDFDHALIYAVGKAWMALNTAPAKMVRFNNPGVDVNDYTILTFANDNFHDFTRDLIYSTSKGKLYMTFLNSSWLCVSEIDPTTLAVTDVIRTNNAKLSHSMCVVDTNFYLTATSTTNTAVLIKYLLSNFAEVRRTNFNTLTAAGAPRTDGTNIYVIGGESSQGWVSRVDPNTMARSITNLLPEENFMGDNQSFFGNNVWVPLFNSAADTNVLVVNKSDLSITRVNTGLNYPCYTLFNDGTYIWRALGSAPGILQRINPITLDMATLTLDSGEDIPADIVTDGTRMFIGGDTGPAYLIRLIPMEVGTPNALIVRSTVNVRSTIIVR